MPVLPLLIALSLPATAQDGAVEAGLLGHHFGDKLVELPWKGCTRDGEDAYYCRAQLGALTATVRLQTRRGTFYKYELAPIQTEAHTPEQGCNMLVSGLFHALGHSDFGFPTDRDGSGQFAPFIHVWRAGTVEVVLMEDTDDDLPCYLQVMDDHVAPVAPSAAAQEVGQHLFGSASKPDK